MQTKGHSGPRALDGSQSLPCPPGPRLPSPPRQHPPSWARPEAPAWAQWGCTVSQMKVRKMDGPLLATSSVGTQSPGICSGQKLQVPCEKAVGALDVQSGEADGPGAGCQPGNTECSFTEQRVHLGGQPLHSQARFGCAFAIWKATSYHCSLRCPCARPRRPVPLSPCPPLRPPTCSPDALPLLPPVFVQGMSFILFSY